MREQGMASTAVIVRDRLVESFRLFWDAPMALRLRGGIVAATGLFLLIAFASYDPADPSCTPGAPGAKCSEVIIDPNDTTKSLIIQRACGRQSWRQLR